MDFKSKYDIFICGGSEHFEMLRELLPRLYPFGKLHLASITLDESEIAELSPFFDALRAPRHHPEGYINFNLFCIRDLNRLARAPYFIKLDADVTLGEDWIEVVEGWLEEKPRGVLWGIKEGLAKINVELSGPLARKKLGRDIRVTGGRKVIGGFQLCSAEFFKRHDSLMQTLHELFFCFEDGRRHRPGPRSQSWPEERDSDLPLFELKGDYRDLQRIGNEDTLRSLVAHVVGEADRLFVMDAKGAISVPHGPGFGHPGDS